MMERLCALYRPEVRLHGKWLEILGFEEGKSIKVLTEQGKLIILASEGEKVPNMEYSDETYYRCVRHIHENVIHK